jgi:hypothetical protein
MQCLMEEIFQGPYRHYILNVLWIFINLLCVMLTVYHLHKLYRSAGHLSTVYHLHKLYRSAGHLLTVYHLAMLYY